MTRVLTIAMFGLIASGCSGQGCGQPIPGGFPLEERHTNMGSFRLTESGISSMETLGPNLVESLLGASGGALVVDVPPDCQSDSKICCDSNNQPVVPCGPVEISLQEIPGGPQRLELTPRHGENEMQVTLRVRVKTLAPISAKIPVVGTCNISYDSTDAGADDLTIKTDLLFRVDSDLGTTKVINEIEIDDLNNGDIDISGGFGCSVADALKFAFKGTIRRLLEDQIGAGVDGALCQKCPSGHVDECSDGATACTDNVCIKGDQCLQTLGIETRTNIGSLSGAVGDGESDLYQVAGGSNTNNGGLGLSLLGGALPARPNDCVPAVAGPSLTTSTPSAVELANKVPSSNQNFDLGIALAENNLNQIGWAMHQAGNLCIDFGTTQSAAISSELLPLIASSTSEYLSGEAVGVEFRLRPQTAPLIEVQGATSPVLQLKLYELDIDLYAWINNQPLRFLTITMDATLPLSVDAAADGGIALGLDSSGTTFKNAKVSYSDPLRENAPSLESSLPELLGTLLPTAFSSIGAIALPEFSGLKLSVVDLQVSNTNHLEIYADLNQATETTATPRVSPSTEVVVQEEEHQVVNPYATFRQESSTEPSGCESNSGSWGLLFVALVLFWRRLNTGTLAALVLVPLFSASCSDKSPCLDGVCFKGAVEPGSMGYFATSANDKEELVGYVYEKEFGDLVEFRIEEDELVFAPVDGIPDEKPVYEPSTYRKGRPSPGDDVGSWARAITWDQKPIVAYRDSTNNALLVGNGSSKKWNKTVVDQQSDNVLGTNISFAAGDSLGVAYRVSAIDHGNGKFASEVRLATSDDKDGPWTVTTVGEAITSCRGLCAANTSCILEEGATESQCVSQTSDCGGGCAQDEICYTGVCYAPLTANPALVGTTGAGTAIDIAMIGSKPLVAFATNQANLTVVFGDSQMEIDTEGHGPRNIAIRQSASGIEIAWQSTSHQVFVTELDTALTRAATTLIDSGARGNSKRRHLVGSSIIWLSDGRVAYQDGSVGKIVTTQGPDWRKQTISSDGQVGFYLSEASKDDKTAITSMGYFQSRKPMGEVTVTIVE